MNFTEQLSIINEFRRGHPPINVELMSRSIGVPVHFVPLDKETSGMIERTGSDQFRIVVNDNDPETRQRFTIAHELGHYILHRHLIGDGVGEDRAYRSLNSGKYQNTAIGRREETEANKFAVNILMPPDAIDLYRREHNDPAAMARFFKVSEHSMCIRLGVAYEPTPSMFAQ